MRFLIDCTDVYLNPGNSTGIQRVVRRVVQQLDSIELEDQLLPVIMLRGKLYPIEALPLPSFSTRVMHRIHQLATAIGRRFDYWERSDLFAQSMQTARLLRVVSRLTVLPFSVVYRLIRVWTNFLESLSLSQPLVIDEDDVLVLLDASWQSNYEPLLQSAKAQGSKIVVAVYDIIPVSHPELFVDRLSTVFERWLTMTARYADGYVAISKTTRDAVYQHLASSGVLPEEAFKHFYLGAELLAPSAELSIRSNLISPQTGRLYLAVGTLEPRKNHHYLLDAFDLLWQQGADVQLVIVGKAGWKCEALLRRVESHPQFGSRLHLYTDANDAELLALYKAAKAIVLASYAEGFGLPIVEALQQGTAVYASDIPVFREVAGNQAQYFDLESPDTLATIIRDDAHTDSAVQLQWIDWQQSAHMLIDAAREIAERK